MGSGSEREHTPPTADELDAADAWNRLVTARDPATKGELLSRIIRRTDDYTLLADLVLALDDPQRVTTLLWTRQYLREHPGHWNEKQEEDLRRSLAGGL